jgi:Phosphoheptose isomerase
MNFPEEKHKDLSLFIKDYSLGIQRGFESIDFQELNKIATLMDEKIHDARTIFTCGNGGSCAISEHFVCDFLKGTADSSSIQPIIHSLSSNVPTVTAIANDISYGEVFSFQLEKYASSEDILICVSSQW